MPSILSRVEFINSLRNALNYLYDPYELNRNPLQSLLVDQSPAPGIGLKQMLINTINSLMPDERTPYDTKAWKVYELLSYRFIDQMEQKETAKTLLISLRTLQRLTPEAIDILAEKLAENYHITLTENIEEIQKDEEVQDHPGNPADSWAKETSSLKIKNKFGTTDNRQMLREISEILRPISKKGKNQVQIENPEESWLIPGQITFLRQAVLTAVSSFQKAKIGLSIVISSGREGPLGVVTIHGSGKSTEFNDIEQLITPDVIDALLKLMNGVNGSVLVERPSPAEASITLKLPVVNRINILMVDDNEDSIKLAGRYLSESIFSLTGVQDPEQVISEINKLKPALILLDIMLPNIDGWMLLGQIRRNPDSSTIPVIVSTILPQEDLATSLGANGFIRKPYTQVELLSVLDQYILKSPTL